MHHFTKIEIGQIDRSIRLGLNRAMRRYGKVAADTDDMIQDAWIKICKNYSAERADSVLATRVAMQSDVNLRAYILKVSPAVASSVQEAPSVVAGFAYRVAFRVAQDAARNAARYGQRFAGSADVEIGEDDSMTLHDVIADDNADFVPKMQKAAKDAAMWTAIADANLSPAQRAALKVDQEDERALTNAERQCKFKAMQKIKACLAA